MNFENLVENFYKSLIKSGQKVIDVGAHSGRHTSPLAAAVKNGKVYAFEPIPFIREYLRHRLYVDKISNSVVQIFLYALSDFNGISEFNVALDRPEESGLRERIYNGITALEKINVEVRRLDDVISPLEKINFLKIDCEGAEYSVLCGAINIIKNSRPTVAFEFGLSSCEAYNVTIDLMYEYFKRINYMIFDIYGNELFFNDFRNTCNAGLVWDFIAAPSEEYKSIKVCF